MCIWGTWLFDSTTRHMMIVPSWLWLTLSLYTHLRCRSHYLFTFLQFILYRLPPCNLYGYIVSEVRKPSPFCILRTHIRLRNDNVSCILTHTVIRLWAHSTSCVVPAAHFHCGLTYRLCNVHSVQLCIWRYTVNISSHYSYASRRPVGETFFSTTWSVRNCCQNG